MVILLSSLFFTTKLPSSFFVRPSIVMLPSAPILVSLLVESQMYPSGADTSYRTYEPASRFENTALPFDCVVLVRFTAVPRSEVPERLNTAPATGLPEPPDCI